MPRRVCHSCGAIIDSGSRCSAHAGTPRMRGRPWSNLRDRILLRDAYACQINGPDCTRIATQVDHIRPLIEGGTDDEANLRAVCVTCHSGR